MVLAALPGSHAMPKKRKVPYLLWRGHHWHAVLEVPKPLRPHFGKRRFMVTLATRGAPLVLRLDER